MSDATNTRPATRTLTQVGPCTILSRAVECAIERGEVRASGVCGHLPVDAAEPEARKLRSGVRARSTQVLSLPLNGECLCKSSFADSLNVGGRARR